MDIATALPCPFCTAGLEHSLHVPADRVRVADDFDEDS